ncbi:MAG: hypothetical protein PUE68_02720 [Kiritimatiellae bacterium]|nr:hypothetical protein [Kiritimatiellia bacterium]
MTTRCYRSKIGRLPFAIRNELNERIRDGVGGPEILAWLNAAKETRKILRELKSGEINAQNLTDWRSSGYRDWLDDQCQADRIRRLAEISQTLASAAGGNAAGVGCNIATAKIMDALESADEEQVADLAKALVQLRAGENAAQKVALAEEKNAIQKEQLELSRAKFERDTARLFVKWAQNKDALSIATDRKLGGDEKTERLGRLMFGDLWEGSGDGK